MNFEEEKLSKHNQSRTWTSGPQLSQTTSTQQHGIENRRSINPHPLFESPTQHMEINPITNTMISMPSFSPGNENVNVNTSPTTNSNLNPNPNDNSGRNMENENKDDNLVENDNRSSSESLTPPQSPKISTHSFPSEGNFRARSVVDWLRCYFEPYEGSSISRSEIYDYYLESNKSETKVDCATFGKIIKNTFPTVVKRRLGKRGNSKYHYAGIRKITSLDQQQQQQQQLSSSQSFKVSKPQIKYPNTFSSKFKADKLQPSNLSSLSLSSLSSVSSSSTLSSPSSQLNSPSRQFQFQNQNQNQGIFESQPNQSQNQKSELKSPRHQLPPSQLQHQQFQSQSQSQSQFQDNQFQFQNTKQHAFHQSSSSHSSSSYQNFDSYDLSLPALESDNYPLLSDSNPPNVERFLPPKFSIDRPESSRSKDIFAPYHTFLGQLEHAFNIQAPLGIARLTSSFWNLATREFITCTDHNFILRLHEINYEFYQKILGNLLQDLFGPIDIERVQLLRYIAKHYESWITSSFPSSDSSAAFTIFMFDSSAFSLQLRRKTSVNYLSQAAQSILQNPELLSNLREDWSNIDRASEDDVRRWTLPFAEEVWKFITESYNQIITRNCNLHDWSMYFDKTVDKFYTLGKQNGFSYLEFSKYFLMNWTFYGSFLCRDLTLHSAKSFGSFHILRSFLDEFAFYIFETGYVKIQSRDPEFIFEVVRNLPALLKKDPISGSDPGGM